MKDKSHNHVQKPKAFSKARIVNELTLTPIKRALTESRNKLVFRHCLKKIIARVVRMLYPGDTKHIGDNLQCENNAHISNASNEERYWKIKSMYVGVKLLDQHRWTCDRDVTQWLPFPTVNDSGNVSVREVRQDDLVFRMNDSSRKVLKKSDLAFSSQSRMCEGVGSEEVDALERRGLWDGVNLRLGVIEVD